MDHEGRIALARRVTDYVLRHHPDVVAVCIHGSVLASGLATPPAATFEDAKRAGLEPKD